MTGGGITALCWALFNELLGVPWPTALIDRIL